MNSFSFFFGSLPYPHGKLRSRRRKKEGGRDLFCVQKIGTARLFFRSGEEISGSGGDDEDHLS